MKNVRLRQIIAMLLNLLVLVLVFTSISWFSTDDAQGNGIGNMPVFNTRCFMFFTNDSNIFAAITALIVIPFNIKSAIHGRDEIPAWVLTLKMVGTAAVSMTLMIVLLFLGPTQGYGKMFTGTGLYLHLLCPMLCIISFCFLERGLFITKVRLLWTLAPVLAYGSVYLVNVIFTHRWADIYGFNIGGMWYISCFVLPCVSYLFSLGLRALHNKFDKISV